MVTSQLNPKVDFTETHTILDNDLQHSSSIYQTEILGKNVELVLGKQHKKEDIAHYVGYVVLNTGKVRPVGIYEIEEKNVDSILDNDGDVELDKL